MRARFVVALGAYAEHVCIILPVPGQSRSRTLLLLLRDMSPMLATDNAHEDTNRVANN